MVASTSWMRGVSVCRNLCRVDSQGDPGRPLNVATHPRARPACATGVAAWGALGRRPWPPPWPGGARPVLRLRCAFAWGRIEFGGKRLAWPRESTVADVALWQSSSRSIELGVVPFTLVQILDCALALRPAAPMSAWAAELHLPEQWRVGLAHRQRFGAMLEPQMNAAGLANEGLLRRVDPAVLAEPARLRSPPR